MIPLDVYFQDEWLVRNIFTSSIANCSLGQTISFVSFIYVMLLVLVCGELSSGVSDNCLSFSLARVNE